MQKLALIALVAMSLVTLVKPTIAQTYAPEYPICLQIYDEGGGYRYECLYDNFWQCNLTAYGRSAECVVNPFFRAIWRGTY
jgi:hypothetical protein